MSFGAPAKRTIHLLRCTLVCPHHVAPGKVPPWSARAVTRTLGTGCSLQRPRGVAARVQRSRETGMVQSVGGPIDVPEPERGPDDGRTDVSEEEAMLHRPVMLEEVMDFLQPSDDQVFLDMTFGAGGHTKAILESCPSVTVYALDRDPVAQKMALNLADRYRPRLHPLLGRFSDLDSLLKSSSLGHDHLDGVLIDAGCSSMQFDDPERGFALSREGPLDMRMDGTRFPSNPSAADVVNNLDAETLARIIRTYGEERYAKKVASTIINYRENHKPIESTQELATLVSLAFTHRQATDSKDALGRRLHVATRTFQALRIFVNDELNELIKGLHAVKPYLRSGGKLAVLTFHSLEDRVVKRFLQGKNVNEKGKSLREWRKGSDWTSEDTEKKSLDWEIVNKKVLSASEFEVSVNPRSRSAKLRAAYKL